MPNSSTRQRTRRPRAVRNGLTGPSRRRVLPQGTRKELGSPCASLWHTAKINGVELQPTAVNVGARGARFAVCRGCGTRRTVASPCAYPGAHGELCLRRVLLVRRVFSLYAR